MERYTAKRRGILIPLEGVAYLRQLSKDDIGEVMSSLFAYVLEEDADEAALPYPLRKAFNAIREEVDKAENEYQRKAKAGAAKKKSGAEPEQTRSRSGADTEQKKQRLNCRGLRKRGKRTQGSREGKPPLRPMRRQSKRELTKKPY